MATVTAANPALIESSPAKPMAYQEAFVHTDATYSAGQFCKLVAGLVKEGTTGAASGVGADAIQLYALTAVSDAIGDSTTVHTFGVVHEDDLWEINEKTTTMARITIGVQYGMDVTSNVCTLLSTDTTHKVFVVRNPTWAERPYSDNSADTLARVTVKVLSTAIYTVGA